MTKITKQNPLHGVTLKMVVTQLVEKYGWEELGRRITIKCFTSHPSITSSLNFLRKTPWARKKVETLYLCTEWQANNARPLREAAITVEVSSANPKEKRRVWHAAD